MIVLDVDELKMAVDKQYKNCHGYMGNKKEIYREAILAVKSIIHSQEKYQAVKLRRIDNGSKEK